MIIYLKNELMVKFRPPFLVTSSPRLPTGIFRATPLKANPKQRNVKAVYKTYIDAIHFRRSQQDRLREQENNSDKHG